MEIRYRLIYDNGEKSITHHANGSITEQEIKAHWEGRQVTRRHDGSGQSYIVRVKEVQFIRI